ncbi:complement factor H-like isoform X2 [Chanodichthys erythropterus]|uniref:complement factor H-like isoform X2 n=1 Tax=Chanodichthys erythropterus TaxID=933992 RepID=UPI00351ECE6F
MRVPVKLLGFVFWLFFFNCGQCRDCLREDIKYENTEPAAKASYSDGETVRLYCMTGFTGMYRLKCEEGTWDTIVERKCAKKKCSHPGDAPNGDFKLTAGSEFVFGATVLYTCKKGFEMTSRINQRTCRAQGWDNTVPVCEAVKCPAIRTNAFVTASGNTEEGSYGDVIHFECVSADKKIDGSSDIHCTETGDWSNSVPTCKEITCTAPVISNGFVVEPEEEYQRDAILKYRCSPGFKAREGIPRCVKYGWTLNPECDEIMCELKSIKFGVQQINPEGKTIFRAGESVEITCTERYRIIGTKQIIRSFKCQENGEWDHQPVCEEIRCVVPRDQHVYDPHSYFWGDMTLGTKKSYYCYDEGQYKRGVATCTRDGWNPKPLCAVSRCEVPRDQHVYSPHSYFSGDMKLGTKKYYYCLDGYQYKEATCTRDGWTPKPLCAGKMCAAPNIPNAEIVGHQRPEYSINSRIQYKCHRGFEPELPVEITCNSQTEWTGIRQCTEATCPLKTTDEDLIIERFPDIKGPIKHGHSLIFSCNREGLILKGEKEITCQSNGEWSSPFPTCEAENTDEVMCVANLTVNMRSDVTDEGHPVPEFSVRPGRTITLTCLGKKVKLQGERKITCQSFGEWSSPFPKCEDKTTDATS